MTGRKLYELVTDSVGLVPDWQRDEVQMTNAPLKAWAFLSRSERLMWNRAAQRIIAKRTRSS